MTPAQEETLVKLREALERGGCTHDVPDLVALAREGKVQVWEEGETLLVTEICEYPQRKVLVIWLAAGHADECLVLLPRVEAFARQQDCTRIKVEGRWGWERLGGQMGFLIVGAVFAKEL